MTKDAKKFCKDIESHLAPIFGFGFNLRVQTLDFCKFLFGQGGADGLERGPLSGLGRFLGEKGVGTAIHYPLGLHLQEAYAPLGHKPGDFPNVDEAATKFISMPMFPEITEEEIDYICAAIGEFYAQA